jgi:hypothetical protein
MSRRTTSTIIIILFVPSKKGSKKGGDFVLKERETSAIKMKFLTKRQQ